MITRLSFKDWLRLFYLILFERLLVRYYREETKAGANPFDTIQVYYDIAALKDKVDKTIVIYHGGIEYQHYPTPEMVKYFRFMIDIGADSVVAHHAHAYSGHECYKGKMIYYGLGNLVSSYKCA